MKHTHPVGRAMLAGLLAIGTVFPSVAQNGPSPVHVGLNLVTGAPMRVMREAVDNNIGGVGVGPGVNVLVNPFGTRKPSMMFVGLDLQYLYFGRDKVEENAVAPPYKTSFNYYSIDGVARFFPLEGRRVNLFLDGLLGLKIMNARTKIDKNAIQTVIADEQEEVINNATDSGLGYGAGIGIFIKRDSETDKGWVESPAFSLRILYRWGDKVSYVKRGSLVVDNGLVSYQQGYTQTDMIQVHLGVYLY